MIRINLDTFAYEEVISGSTAENLLAPAPRYAPSLAWTGNSKLILFGGGGGSFLNDLWSYDMLSNVRQGKGWGSRGGSGFMLG